MNTGRTLLGDIVKCEHSATNENLFSITSQTVNYLKTVNYFLKLIKFLCGSYLYEFFAFQLFNRCQSLYLLCCSTPLQYLTEQHIIKNY